MTEKDLKKLKCSGALQEIENRDHEIKVLSDQITSLQNKNRELKDQLADRTLKMEKCGSIAEAALVVNKVLSDAQKAADQYLESIKVKESGAEQIVTELTDRTKAACKAQLDTTKAKCELMESESRKKSEDYWNDLTSKLDAYYESHEGLKDLLKHDNIEVSLPSPENK